MDEDYFGGSWWDTSSAKKAADTALWFKPYNFNFGNTPQQQQTTSTGLLGSLFGNSTPKYDLTRGLGDAPTQAARMLQERNIGLQNQALEQMIKNQEFGLNFNTLNNVMGGINSAANLWGGYQSYKMAKDQWGTQKSILNTNMMNQISSYNAALKDKLSNKKHWSGSSQEEMDAQFDLRKARQY